MFPVTKPNHPLAQLEAITSVLLKRKASLVLNMGKNLGISVSLAMTTSPASVQRKQCWYPAVTQSTAANVPKQGKLSSDMDFSAGRGRESCCIHASVGNGQAVHGEGVVLMTCNVGTKWHQMPFPGDGMKANLLAVRLHRALPKHSG